MTAHVPSHSFSSLDEDQTPLSADFKNDATQVRSLANYSPSKWRNYFTNCSMNEDDLSSQWCQIEELTEVVRSKLNLLADKPLTQLKMIDALQQLGLGYQFQEDIDQTMILMFEITDGDIATYDLYHTSLYFRLLRQHGYNVSSDIFKKFIDTTSGALLKEEFQIDAHDVLGMVNFYEAAQLRTSLDGETFDEDALARFVSKLKSMASDNINLSTRLKKQITDALEQSIHKDMPWLRAWKYIETFQDQDDNDESHDPTLLSLAKLHFNVLQTHHQRELSDISKWWNDLNTASKFPYARDRLVEAYVWAVAIFYEPQFSVGRKIFSKFVAILATIDDTYDAYGTSDELALLTEAIARGDTSMFPKLPAYATELCQIILNNYVEIEQDMAREGRSFLTPNLIKWTKNITKFYYEEYNSWHKNKHVVPSMEEYRRVRFASSNTTATIIFSLAGLGNDVITEAAFDWVSSEPDMLVACQVIGRFLDDIVGHEFEQKREHPPSAVECYMNEYGVSKEEACKELSKEISEAWKVLNQGCMKPTSFPFPVIERILNFARSIEVLYKHEDTFTHPGKLMEQIIRSLLVHPLVI